MQGGLVKAEEFILKYLLGSTGVPFSELEEAAARNWKSIEELAESETLSEAERMDGAKPVISSTASLVVIESVCNLVAKGFVEVRKESGFNVVTILPEGADYVRKLGDVSLPESAERPHAYIIHTPKGKEKRVIAVLQKHGFEAVRSPYSEYVVCKGHKDPSKILTGIKNVKVTPCRDQDYIKIAGLGQGQTGQSLAGKLVRIKSGTCAGFTGKVTKVEKERVYVQLSVFGKVIQVDVGENEVEILSL